MDLTSVMTYVRLALTAIITGLTAVYSYYPHLTWIMAVVAVAGTLGIHAVPSVAQSNAADHPANPTEHTG